MKRRWQHLLSGITKDLSGCGVTDKAVSQFPCSAIKNEQAYDNSSGRGKFLESILVVPKMKQTCAVVTVLFQNFHQELVWCLYIFLAVFLSLHDKQK